MFKSSYINQNEIYVKRNYNNIINWNSDSKLKPKNFHNIILFEYSKPTAIEILQSE